MNPEEVAELAARRAKKDPHVRRVAEDVQLYDGLLQHNGWKHLRKRFADYREAVSQRIARRLLSGDEVSQREIDFCRGYAASIEDIFRQPELVTKDLERAAEQAWERAVDELTTTEEETPYA